MDNDVLAERSGSGSSSESSSSTSFISSKFFSTCLSSSLSITLHHHRVFMYLLLTLPLAASTGSAGPDVTEVRVSSPAEAGKPLQLECIWAAGESGFSSVRWYRNEDMFYSFIKQGEEQDKVDHRVEGLYVEKLHSDERRVVLRDIGLEAEGTYKCEVMAESPTFETAYAYANVTVIVMPKTPDLKGLRQKYNVGDTLNVTCTAENARPPAKITFKVNDRVIHRDSGRMIEMRTVPGIHREVYTTRSMLVLPLADRHVPQIVVVCTASVATWTVQARDVAHVEHLRRPIISFFNDGCQAALAPSVMALVACLHLLLPYW